MTIFHVIKYANIDILNEQELYKLPASVLHDWLYETRIFLISSFESLSSIKTKSLIDNIMSIIDDYVYGNINVDDFEDGIHDSTKHILRNADADIKLSVISECAWCIFYSLVTLDVMQNAIDLRELILSIDDRYKDINFYTIFSKNLKILLLEYDE